MVSTKHFGGHLWTRLQDPTARWLLPALDGGTQRGRTISNGPRPLGPGPLSGERGRGRPAGRERGEAGGATDAQPWPSNGRGSGGAPGRGGAQAGRRGHAGRACQWARAGGPACWGLWAGARAQPGRLTLGGSGGGAGRVAGWRWRGPGSRCPGSTTSTCWSRRCTCWSPGSAPCSVSCRAGPGRGVRGGILGGLGRGPGGEAAPARGRAARPRCAPESGLRARGAHAARGAVGPVPTVGLGAELGGRVAWLDGGGNMPRAERGPPAVPGGCAEVLSGAGGGHSR